jgi:hypothetical protein
MTDRPVDIRTELAASKRTRVDIGEDGVLHVLAGPITLHLDRASCEELTTTLARAMVALARARRPRLHLVTEPAGGTDVTNHAVPSGRGVAIGPQSSDAPGEHGVDDA